MRKMDDGPDCSRSVHHNYWGPDEQDKQLYGDISCWSYQKRICIIIETIIFINTMGGLMKQGNHVARQHHAIMAVIWSCFSFMQNKQQIS
jgi:hypothetical protein